ncbi:MAG: hypothetical protein SV775_05550 [Thermodesulfobacteriota bacterium]|nr:hypothetical protein [Thermodesulfobacteriota bacterium]
MNMPTIHFSFSVAGFCRFAVLVASCAVIHACASTSEDLPEGRMKQNFEACDTNGDDMITWKEFRSRNSRMPKRKARKQFNRYDLDKDGIIKVEEVIKIHDSL